MRITICDDDPAALASLETMVQQYLGDTVADVAVFSSYGAFQTARRETDLLLVDIDLGDGSGIALAKGMKACHPETAVIFVTAHLEYVEESFEADPLYFLVKPVRPDSFQRAMDRALERLKAVKESKLLITFQNRVCAVNLADIQYVEFSVRCATVHAGDRLLRTYEKLASLQQRLDARFVQCHKSYLVNMDYVFSLRGNALELSDGQQIPVSQSRSRATREALLRHLAGRIS